MGFMVLGILVSRLGSMFSLFKTKEERAVEVGSMSGASPEFETDDARYCLKSASINVS
jgi:hypothetical protein